MIALQWIALIFPLRPIILNFEIFPTIPIWIFYGNLQLTFQKFPTPLQLNSNIERTPPDHVGFVYFLVTTLAPWCHSFAWCSASTTSTSAVPTRAHLEWTSTSFLNSSPCSTRHSMTLVITHTHTHTDTVESQIKWRHGCVHSCASLSSCIPACTLPSQNKRKVYHLFVSGSFPRPPIWTSSHQTEEAGWSLREADAVHQAHLSSRKGRGLPRQLLLRHQWLGTHAWEWVRLSKHISKWFSP